MTASTETHTAPVVGYADAAVQMGFTVLASTRPDVHQRFLARLTGNGQTAVTLTADDLADALTTVTAETTAARRYATRREATCRTAKARANEGAAGYLNASASSDIRDAERVVAAARGDASADVSVVGTAALAALPLGVDIAELAGLELPDLTMRLLTAARAMVEGKLTGTNGSFKIQGLVADDGTVYGLDGDTKVLSNLIEALTVEALQDAFAAYGLRIEVPSNQNTYPDITVHDDRTGEMVAVDIKTGFRAGAATLKNPLTLGAYSGYFRDRSSTKCTLYPYGDYLEHFVFGVIYDRDVPTHERTYALNELGHIPAGCSGIEAVAQPKWAIAAAAPGSGNTKNIGSSKQLDVLRDGHGPFVVAAAQHGIDPAELFDEYWMNFGDGYRTLDGFLKLRLKHFQRVA